MEIRVGAGDIVKSRVDVLIVNLFQGTKRPGGATAAVDKALDGAISKLVADGEIKGAKGELTLIHTFGKIAPARVAVLGLGTPKDFNSEVIRWVMGAAARAIRKIGVKRAATVLHGAGAGGVAPEQAARAVAEGVILGLYTFNKYKRDNGSGQELRELTILERDRSKLAEVRRGVQVGRVVAESTCLARDMVNEPANHMNPEDIASVARKVGAEGALEVSVMEREEMEGLGMGALLGVARGSAQPPRFIVMNYRGDPDHSDKVMGLVGKGVTFDTGGISLKPAAGMAEMKTDMAGGASVVAAMRAISLLKPKINVTGLVPAAENMPSSTAQKPGDIVRALNGKTIEVENTDAEGRLLLADALSYGRKLGLAPMIDIATLTGAMRTSLGDICTGAFTNHQRTLDRLLKSASATGEKMWQLPMYEEYRRQNRSEVADVKNTGGRSAGSITAAWFLAEFSEKTPWVHLDIAGTARASSAKGYLVTGASGTPVRTLVQFVLDSANDK